MSLLNKRAPKTKCRSQTPISLLSVIGSPSFWAQEFAPQGVGSAIATYREIDAAFLLEAKIFQYDRSNKIVGNTVCRCKLLSKEITFHKEFLADE